MLPLRTIALPLLAVATMMVGCSDPLCGPTAKCIPPPQLTVHVEDAATHQPLVAIVTATRDGTAHEVKGTCAFGDGISDGGCYAAANLDDGTYTVTGSATGYASESSSVEIGKDSCDRVNAKELTLSLAPDGGTATSAHLLVDGAKSCGQ